MVTRATTKQFFPPYLVRKPQVTPPTAVTYPKSPSQPTKQPRTPPPPAKEEAAARSTEAMSHAQILFQGRRYGNVVP